MTLMSKRNKHGVLDATNTRPSARKYTVDSPMTPEYPSPIKSYIPDGIASIYRPFTSPSSATRPITSGSLSFSSSVRLSKRPSTRIQQQDLSKAARYGKIIRFQTDDGGFLLVDNDGSMWKAPSDFENDPRTHLVLLPSVTDTSNYLNKCVRSCDGTFIGQRADKLMASTRLVYADSYEIVPVAERIQQKAVAYLEEVVPDTTLTNNSSNGTNIGWKPQQKEQEQRRPFLRPISAILPEKPLQKPWRQYSEDKGIKLTPTNVWQVKCLNSSSCLNPNQIRSSLSSISTLPYLFHGMQVQLLQNDAVLLHERFRKEKKKFGLQLTSSSSTGQLPTTTTFNTSSSTNRSTLSQTKSNASLINMNIGDDTASVAYGENSDSTTRDRLNHVWLRPQEEKEKSKEVVNGRQQHKGEEEIQHPPNPQSPMRSSHTMIWSSVWTIHVVEYEEAQREIFLQESILNQRPSTSPCLPTSSPNMSSSKGLVEKKQEKVEDEDEDEDETTKEIKQRYEAAAKIISRFIVRTNERGKAKQTVHLFASRAKMHHRKQLDPLSTKEQLYLLQSYHPHIFGPRLFADDDIADDKKKKKKEQQKVYK
jgi:hypothetical protein